MGQPPALPARCFLSHSYEDAEAVDIARRVLGPRTTLVTFPRRTVDAEKMVSDYLFDRISECAALVYLKGGASTSSFWVRLETDFAKRAHLPIFAFDATDERLEPDTSEPIEIRVVPVYERHDELTVFRILRYLERERFLGELFDDRGVDLGSHADSWSLLPHARTRCLLFFTRAQSHVPVLPAEMSAGFVIAALDREAQPPEHVTGWQFTMLCRRGVQHITTSPLVFNPFQPGQQRIVRDPRELPGPEWFAGDEPISASREMRKIRRRFQESGQRSPWALPEGLDLRRLDDLVVRMFRVCAPW